MPNRRLRLRKSILPVSLLAVGLSAAACGGSDATPTSSGAASGDERVSVSLITKTANNPFFISMQNGAKEAAAKNNVDLNLEAGKEDGDEQSQVQAIEAAVTRGDKGILITPSGPGVNLAIENARAAGLYVIALDTPPEPADIVDITFATDNFKAGELIGKWAASKLDGKKATIALIDAFNDKVVTTDYKRDQGFLSGMGVDIKDNTKMGDEEKVGQYSGGAYEIACQEPSQATQDGAKTAMEQCLTKNRNINLVYTINEPAGIGASEALETAGNKDTILVSIDGGCPGVAAVKDGLIGATSQQYPVKMAQLGVEAIAEIARGGEKPTVTQGLDFYDTGVALVTDQPEKGVDSIDSTEGAKLCWGG
jgi:fructose transport system substrate-binding protein